MGLNDIPENVDSLIAVDGGGRLRVEAWAAGDLAERFGTPLYVYSENQLRRNYRRFLGAFAARYPDVRVHFGTKSNNNVAVLRVFAQEGGGADCFGPGELSVAMAAGMRGDRLILNGSNKTDEELALAVRAGATVNVDAPEELGCLERVAEGLGARANANLRLRLPLHSLDGEMIEDHRYHPPHISLGRWVREHKFGMPLEEAERACKQALRSPWLNLRGLHYHLKSQTTEPAYYRAAIGELVEFAARLRDGTGWTPRELDLGGGFPYGRAEGFGPGGNDRSVPPIDEFARVIVDTVREKLGEHGLPAPSLRFEPGRWLVAGAGVLLTRVGAVKSTPDIDSKTWVHVDASINQLMRVALANWYHHAVVADRALARPERVVDLVGPQCNAADILGAGRPFPSVRRGEVIAFLDTGGYAESNQALYNTLPRAAAVLVAGDQADLITRRETVQDFMARFEIPPRLAGDQSAGPLTR